MAGVVVVEERTVTVVDEGLRNVRYGWYVIFGIIAIIFGGLVVFYPGISTAFMVILAAVLLLIFGLYGIVSGFMQPAGEKAVPVVLGLIGAVIGAAGLIWPLAFGFSLVVLLGVLILLMGALMIVFSIVEKEFPHRWLLFFLGLISVIFAILFFIYPVYTAVGIGILIGIYFIFAGLMSIIAGFQIRGLKKKAFG